MENRPKSFIVELYSKAFEVLSFTSFPLRFLIYATRSRLDPYHVVEFYVLFNTVLSMVVFFIAAHRIDVNATGLLIAFAIYGAYRTFDIVQTQANILLFDEYRSRKKGIEYKVRGYRRIVILLLHNYAEVVFWFATFYVYLLRSNTIAVLDTEISTGSLLILRESMLAMFTFSNTNLVESSGLGSVVFTLQSMIGVLMTVIVFARFLSLLPKPNSIDEFEACDVPIHAEKSEGRVTPTGRQKMIAERKLLPRVNVVLLFYLLFLMLPIYWLLNMSLKTNTEILNAFTLWPDDLTLDNYRTILSDPAWYMGYVNSIIYVTMNTVLSVAVALPAAYAFSRYRFLGDKHLFFWLLTNRMAPPAVFALPFFQLYSSVGLFDTHIAVALAHTLFNVPLAVWILEGFMRGVPKEIDETAYIDGYSFGHFFVKIFTPLIASGIGVAAFFCFMFSWVELLLSRTLTTVDAKPIAAIMTRTQGAAGIDWGVLAAAGVLTIVPGALVIYFVRNYIAKGFALGRV